MNDIKHDIKKRHKNLTEFRYIAVGFFLTILSGAIMLSLPFSSRDGQWTNFLDSLFTATSATCVTGLVVFDTFRHWSIIGQLVILVLIQIGGMGFISIGVAFSMLLHKKIGLRQRDLMQESVNALEIGGIVRLFSMIIRGTFLIEGIGAVLLAIRFIPDFGILRGIYFSVFHSISAFCNAGFDLFGIKEPFSSLTFYHSNIYLNIIIMLLIITGGIGFLVWGDIGTHKHRIRRFSLQSKVVLMTSAVLIVLPALYFFFFEYDHGTIHDRTIHSLFQSVTTRTAGFNTTDLAAMDESGTAIMVILMLIGGSPGSTAGGMKTTTFAVLLLSAITVFSRRNDVQCFKRRISDETVRSAGAVLFMYLVLFFTSGVIISRVENLPLLTCLFETSSAIGTVGLSLGITSGLSAISRVILMILMFFGRVGGLTLIYAALPSADSQNSRLPLEKISVG